MTPETLAIIFGLTSALTWGAGDFSGGMATRRSSVYTVIIVSQVVGMILLAGLALLWQEAWPSAGDLVWAAAAGLAGAVGLLALYSGLAGSRMGIVAPLAAVTSAGLPVIVALFTEGLPRPLQLAGFGLALLAVWFLSHSGGNGRIQLQELILPVTAGIGFALFFILIDRVSEGAVFWPLVAARLASVSVLALFMLIRRKPIKPSRSQLPLMALAGILDSGGNLFFLLAAQAGRLDIAAVLSSLYPASTVFLAWLVLQERLDKRQWWGVAAALVALVLIAV
jgi:drug/metabolite transporter (DMT)-like permease